MRRDYLAERTLLILGLVLLGTYGIVRISGSILSQVELWRFASLQRAADVAPSSVTDSPWPVQEETDTSLWSTNRIKAFQDSLAKQFAAPLAILRVPKINLEVAVLEGADELALNRAVGRMIGTAPIGGQGNIGIAGHRDGFFRGLSNVREGDRLELVTPERTQIYRVSRILIVKPQDVYVLNAGPTPSMTLVTCYPYYFVGKAPERYIVQALLTGESPEDRDLSVQAAMDFPESIRTNGEKMNFNRTSTQLVFVALIPTLPLAGSWAWAQQDIQTEIKRGRVFHEL